MNEMKPLSRHYLLLFPMMFILIVLGFLFGLKSLWITFFALGILWPWGLLTPELKEKVKSPRYRFSFFRFMYWIEKQVDGQLFFESKFSLKIISRIAGPVIFSFLLSLIGGFEIFLSCLFGVLISEGWLYLNRKFYPEAYEKRPASLSENSL